MGWNSLGLRLRGMCICVAVTAEVGCTPSVKVLTPDPLKVDMTVRLDIYQQQAPQNKSEELSIEVAAHRRQRLPDINQLKSDKIAGENNIGYLELVTPEPTDPAVLDRARKLVDAENSDRALLYANKAASTNDTIEKVEVDYADIWRNRALPGQWIQDKEGKWKQK